MENNPKFKKCPRCEDNSFEHLKTFGFCANCDFSTEDLIVQRPLIPQWALKALKGAQ